MVITWANDTSHMTYNEPNIKTWWHVEIDQNVVLA